MACSLRLLQKAAPLLRQELKEQGLYALYQDVEVPLAAVLAAMEQKGILVDPRRLQDISADLERVLAKLTESIHSQAGEKFNINSPKQLGVVLFEKNGGAARTQEDENGGAFHRGGRFGRVDRIPPHCERSVGVSPSGQA